MLLCKVTMLGYVPGIQQTVVCFVTRFVSISFYPFGTWVFFVGFNKVLHLLYAHSTVYTANSRAYLVILWHSNLLDNNHMTLNCFFSRMNCKGRLSSCYLENTYGRASNFSKPTNMEVSMNPSYRKNWLCKRVLVRIP